jgi:hypothetical protein
VALSETTPLRICLGSECSIIQASWSACCRFEALYNGIGRRNVANSATISQPGRSVGSAFARDLGAEPCIR